MNSAGKTTTRQREPLRAWFSGMPFRTAAILIALCAIPFLLMLVGVDFSSHAAPTQSTYTDLDSAEAVERIFESMSGSFTHTILEWTASIIALITVVLAFANFSIKRDVVTPVIALALLAAGTMDAFHTLAADRLIDASASSADLIPFTWAICRTFNAVIPLCALVMLIFLHRWSPETAPRRSILVVGAVAVVLTIASSLIITYYASSPNLPQTTFADAIVTRPWDIYPLVIYALSAVVLYPLFSRTFPSFFAKALWLSVIPDVATQVHMAFGSTALFDAHFNIAHGMKILAYGVPLIGLAMDYVQTYQQVAREALELHVAEERARFEASRRIELEQVTKDLRVSNRELEQFAYVASHDLQEPIRMVANFSKLIEREYAEQLGEQGQRYVGFLVGGAERMETLVADLLSLSRLSSEASPMKNVDLNSVLGDVVGTLEKSDTLNRAKIEFDDLPVVVGNRSQLTQVFQNLIGNAVKFNKNKLPRVDVGATAQGEELEVWVRDNGIGIEERHREQIFDMFKRLNKRSDFGGTGIGLAIVSKVIGRHGGRIWVESVKGEGSTFRFTLPLAEQTAATPVKKQNAAMR